MGKILDWALTDSWEEYQRVQLYKKLGKKLEPPEEQPKKMGFGEAMGNLSVAIAESKRLKAKKRGKSKGKRNIKAKKNKKVYHLTKKELDKIIKDARKKKGKNKSMKWKWQ